MEQKKQNALFEYAPLRQSFLQLALPTVIGQVILVLYNMADTFFIGMTGDEAKLTALTVCTPAFMVLSAIANLFGIGGAGAVSRALGVSDPHRAENASALALRGCILTTAAYGAAVFLLMHPLINLLGGSDAAVHGYAAQYLRITVVLGGMATALSAFLSHMLRAEGRGFSASVGIAMGGVLNICLDPLFMFVLCRPGREAVGAAIATALSNLISLVYFAVVLLLGRKKGALHFRLRMTGEEEGLHGEIFSAGFPACIMTLCENLSFAVLEKLLSLYGVPVQAGIGVAKKLNMLAHSMVRGMAQGMMPVIAYNFSSGNRERMRRAALLSTGVSAACALACTVVCLLFAPQLTGLFLDGDTGALEYGIRFLRILCLGGPFSACAYTCISFFQATRRGPQALLLAVLRKGILDIPLMFLLIRRFPIYGAVWATPVTDLICSLAAGLILLRLFRKKPCRFGRSVV